MPKNKIKFAYRSTCGKIMVMTDYPSGSVQSAINEHIEESKDSTTPLVWIEGTGVKRINLNILPFLKKEKQMLEEDLRNTKKQIESLSREIARVK